jgi:hypothetical protein
MDRFLYIWNQRQRCWGWQLASMIMWIVWGTVAFLLTSWDFVFNSCLLRHSNMISGAWRNIYPAAVVYDHNVLGGTTGVLSFQQHQVRNCPSDGESVQNNQGSSWQPVIEEMLEKCTKLFLYNVTIWCHTKNASH